MLDEAGEVKEARFHVTQYRGFEVFTKGRDFREMPVITPRICGIRPVSHHLASAKACDDILGVTITPAAHKLRAHAYGANCSIPRPEFLSFV